jgi:polyhydroxybutyrate depolymerase
LCAVPAFIRKTAGLFAAFLVLLGLMSFACSRAAGASERSPAPAAAAGKARAAARVTSGAESTSTKTYLLKVGDRTRKYEVISPVKPLPKSAPIIVTLSGLYATLGVEVARDDLVPYASAGEAELAYPVAVHESWNAVGCCSYAGAHNVNDLAFLKALVVKLDPKRARRIYLVGYSNGARLAYRVACTTPGLFNAYAMVKGVPLDNCVVKKPASIVQLAALDDPEVPYAHGGASSYEVPVLTEVKRLRTTDKCPAEKAVTHSKQLIYLTWSGCADGTRLALAAWKTGRHLFPSPPVNVPAGAQVIWAFFTKSPIRALPSEAA